MGRRSSGAIHHRPHPRLPQLPVRSRHRHQLRVPHRPRRTSSPSFGLQYDHPGGVRRTGPVPGAAPAPATGWTNVPVSYSPARGDAAARARLRRRQVRAERLPLRPDERHGSTTTRVLFSPTKSGADKVADLREGSGPTSRSSIQGGDLDGKTAAMLIKVERLSQRPVRRSGCSTPRSPGRSRSWPTWPGEPGFTGTFEDYVADHVPVVAGRRLRRARGRHRQRGHLRRAGAVLGDQLYHPIIKYVAREVPARSGDGRISDHRRVPAPVPRPRHQDPAATATANPAYDDVEVNGTPDHRVRQREGYIRRAYSGADATMRLAQRLLDRAP